MTRAGQIVRKLLPGVGIPVDDANGSPIGVPPVIPLTEIEQQRYDSAPRRREVRLILSGRMKAEDATDLKDFFKQFSSK